MDRNNKAAPVRAAPNQTTKRTDSSEFVTASSSATADESYSELFERAASVLGKSIFRNRSSSPDVSTLEEALRVLMIDASEYHRHKASVARGRAGFLFEEAA